MSDKKRSFGLLEVVIVLGIFLMTISTVLTISALSYRNLILNENRWKASLIAQNWLDEYRNQRDTNILSGQIWDWWGNNPPDPLYLPNSDTTKYRCYGKDMGEITLHGQQCRTGAGPFYEDVFFEAKLDYTYHYPDASSNLFKVTVTWNQFGRERNIFYSSFLKDFST